jgi:hypothetical protein
MEVAPLAMRSSCSRLARPALASCARPFLWRSRIASSTPRLAIGGVRYLQLDHKKQDPPIKGKRIPKVTRGQSKVYKSADEAVADLQSGSVILSAGFGLCGTAGKPFDSKVKTAF